MSKCISIGLFFSSLILIQMQSLVFAAGYCPNGCYNETNRPCELVTCSSSRSNSYSNSNSNSNSNSSTQSNRTSNQNYEPAARAVGQLLNLMNQMDRDQAAADERAQRNLEIEKERSRQEEAANNARKQYEEQQAQERLRSAEQDASLNPWGNNDSNKFNKGSLPLSSYSNATSNSSLSDKYSRPMTDCVSSEIDQSKSDKYGTYYRLTNKCQVRISVIHYVDGNSWGGHQGKGDLDPGQSTTTVKVYEGSTINYRACEIPAGKQWVTTEKTDEGGFMCLILQ